MERMSSPVASSHDAHPRDDKVGRRRADSAQLSASLVDELAVAGVDPDRRHLGHRDLAEEGNRASPPQDVVWCHMRVELVDQA